jgi:hypothetical protein
VFVDFPISATPPTVPIPTQPSDRLLMGAGRHQTGGMVIMLLCSARCREQQIAERPRDRLCQNPGLRPEGYLPSFARGTVVKGITVVITKASQERYRDSPVSGLVPLGI